MDGNEEMFVSGGSDGRLKVWSVAEVVRGKGEARVEMVGHT